MPDAVAQSLQRELPNIGIDPGPLCIKLVGARIADRGETEFERLSRENPLLMPHRAVCVRHLGVGASFTEFLISSLQLNRDSRSAVASLGGIAHTIYAVFDSLLDESQSVPNLFAAQDPCPPADVAIRSKHQLVIDLVNLYFRDVNLLSPGNPRILAFLERAIQKLYRAELRSAEPNHFRWSTWWRKNVLPIVIMGVPAWLSVPTASNISFADHLRWLARVGEFLGWLDDFSDYDRDCSSGQINRLTFESGISIPALAKRVSAKGRRVLEAWDAVNADSPARDTFTVITWMWLAAPDSELSTSRSAVR